MNAQVVKPDAKKQPAQQAKTKPADAPWLKAIPPQDARAPKTAGDKNNACSSQQEKGQEKKEEGDDFANRCIIDMYNCGSRRMNGGLYALG